MIGLIVIFIIILYIYIAYRFIKYIIQKTEKKLYWVLTILFFILLPTWDMIIGNIYFQHLCETQGGLKVYKSVEADGVIKNTILINHQGGIFKSDNQRFKELGFKYIEGIKKSWKGKEIQHLNLTNANQTIQIIKEPQSKYIFIYNEKTKPIRWLPIVKNRALVKNRLTNEVLGEDIGFKYFGSWIGIIFNHLVSGVSNPAYECIQDKDKLLKQTLKVVNNGE